MKRNVLLAALLVLVALPNAAQAQEIKFIADTITVQAEGKFEADPDLATLSFHIASQEKELKRAYDAAAQSMQKIVALAERNGLRKEEISTGALTEWTWDLGDLLAGEGRISKERNPVYVYRVPGRYTVRLRVKGPHGEDEVEKVRYIHVKEEGDGQGGGRSSSLRPQPKPKAPESGGLSPKPPKESQAPKTFVPSELKVPEAPKDLVEKVVRIYQPPPPGAPGGPDDKPLDVVLPEYRRAAEDSIERERIPPVLREHLRRYFDGLRPK